MILRLIFLFPLVACGKKHDKCQQFVDKSTPVLKQIGAGKITNAKLEELVELCRSKPANQDQKLMDCVLAAADQATVADCWQAGFKAFAGDAKRDRAPADDEADAEPTTEADAELDRLGELAKAYYASHKTFPEGAQPPGVNCCHQVTHECIADPSLWNGMWKQLGFTIDHPYHAQYSYYGSKASFIAKALVDTDCDGQTVEVIMHGVADDSRNVTIQRGAPSGTD